MERCLLLEFVRTAAMDTQVQEAPGSHLARIKAGKVYKGKTHDFSYKSYLPRIIIDLARSEGAC